MKQFQPQGMALAAMATLLALAGTGSAQAARLALTDRGVAVDVISQSATVDGIDSGRSISGALLDGSGAGTLLQSDFQAFGPATQGGVTLEDGHGHLLAVDATGASTDLTVDASHHWSATGTGTGSIGAYSLVQSLSLDGLTFGVVGDAGEVLGQAVNVRFSGLAQALLSGAADVNDLGVSLDVVQGSTTLASYSGLWTGDASDTVDFSFSAMVGDHFTVLLSAYNGANLNMGRALNGRTEFGNTVNLQGSFTVTAVPEPGSVGLALVGLLVAGLAARRRA
jgi:PEP-CTERM motif